MHQLDNLESAAYLSYEPQVRARVLEGALAPGTPAHKLPVPHEVSTRTYQSQVQRFRGRLQVDNLNVAFPEQDFSLYVTHTGGYIENHPVSHWPNVRIDLVFNPVNEQLETKSFRIASADDTVEAGLLYTRLVFAIYTSGKFCLQRNSVDSAFEIITDKLSLSEKEVLSQAKLFRKLRYIESVFKREFRVPEDISKGDASLIEILFRGITEGKFTTRGGNITFCDYITSADKLNGPPFTEPGSFTHRFSTRYELAVFGQSLPVGSVTIHLERAAVANQRVLDSLRNDGQQPVNLRFIVFDHQVTYCFEKYVGHTQHFQRKIAQLKKKLMHEEPAQLAKSLTDSFSKDVSADEASQIVMGWLQFYHFPDRYCPQEPKLEEDRWRVPIWIAYPQGRGAWVQDAFVDLKTGVVTVPVSVEELRNLGKSVAAECLRAS